MNQYSKARRLAISLVNCAAWMLQPERADWARAMVVEVEQIPSDLAALRWSFGCVLAGSQERMAIMTRSGLDVSRWLLGLEALVCLGPLTLLWSAALYVMSTRTPTPGATMMVPILIGTLGPIGLLLTLYNSVLRRSVSSTSFKILAVSFGVLALVHLLNPTAPWFAFHWRVWMLTSVLPGLACLHFALARLQLDRPSRELSAA